MARFLWCWLIAFVLLMGFEGGSYAQQEAPDLRIFGREVRVCVRPPGVSANVTRWSYTTGGSVVTNSSEFFLAKTAGMDIFVYDPDATRVSPKSLPFGGNKLKCPDRVLPDSVLPNKREVPPDQLRPEDRPAKRPAGEAKIADQLVLKTCPNPLLPSVTVRPGGPAPMTAACGDCKPKKSSSYPAWLEKFADELAHAGAIATLQMNEEERADGKRYGIPGGRSPNGPNNPIAQAVAGGALVVLGVLTAANTPAKTIKRVSAQFEKVFGEALKKKVPLLVSSIAGMNVEIAKTLANRWGVYLAQALEKNGAIGPYAIMKEFTAGQGGAYQAHHLLEKSMVGEFKLGNPDLVPSVILTDAEHKVITAELRGWGPIMKEDKLEKLWQKYLDVYGKQHPDWLQAIEPLFTKGK